MKRRSLPRTAADRERLARRALDARRCRARRRAGKAILPLEADGETFNLMIYFAGLEAWGRGIKKNLLRFHFSAAAAARIC
jgi:hypothetical protein